MPRHINIGNKGEDIACSYLEQNDFAIIERNWRHKHWEIDIIATKSNKLHFIEVKTRTSQKFGKPEESIDDNKMRVLKKAAEEYLLLNEQWINIQFDVIAIILNGNITEEIFYIEDVFF